MNRNFKVLMKLNNLQMRVLFYYLSITHYVSESASKVKLELHNVQWGDKTVFCIKNRNILQHPVVIYV